MARTVKEEQKTLTTHVKALMVALAVALAASLLMLAGPLAQPAETQTAAPPTLTGETFFAVEPPSPQQTPTPTSVTANCNPNDTATIEYEVSGVAAGPYPGTFTESGTFTLSAPSGPGGLRVVESFSAEFEIDSAVGQITGTKSAEDLPIAAGSGLCQRTTTPLGELLQATAQATVRYEATIETASGDFTDRGTTNVEIQDFEQTFLGSTLFQEFFRENFLSDLLEPEPLLPTTKEQCKDGGYEAFQVFENQGDCVSFVATGGKNEPGKNQK